jgi:hypothetical protein
MVETESTIINKEIVSGYGNNYQISVTYEIDGVTGYEATIKVSKQEFDRVEIGDLYTFERPAP